MSVVGSCANRFLHTAGLSGRHAIVRRNVLRKIKRGIDRLPSQGPDPAVTSATPHGWRLASAAVLERYPVVVPEPHPFEAQYVRGRFLWEASVARPAPEELFVSERDAIDGGKSNDEATAEMYVPGPIETEADAKGDVRSLNRALRERLYFVVKRSATSKYFQFPQTLATSDDVPMTAYAELALQSSFIPESANKIRAHFISNMPGAHLAHEFSREHQESTGYHGVKLFFYRAQLISGSVSETKFSDFAWARESELEGLLSPETFRSVKPILFGITNKLDINVKYEEGEDCAQW